MKQFKITHFLSFLFLFVLLATTLSSCKSASVVPPATTETTKTITIKEVVRDTIFKTEKDSSYYKAYLNCVNGKVVVKQDTKPIIKLGKFLQPPKVSLKDNILTIDCKAEAQKLFAQWKDIYRENMKSVLTTKYVEVEKPLTYWQKTEIILGRIFLGLILCFTALGVLKYFKYI
ncbi:hypothetical protein [Flavobacterium sp. UBA6046]|jgi:hypothetical protein|uniref:hypothetical protein n=1 Tax=Flavobacterium sp. UBA6046 TaxID=1946552 RepID=UPI0025C66F2C|nr:hypothetical protein [Flavobacterium sp. UBA6046]